MPIETGMYSALQPVQVQTPQPLQVAEAGLRLSELGLQNRQMQYQMAQQMGVRQAYADNTDASGNLNRQGFLSDLGKNPATAQMASDYSQKFAAQDKAQAEAQSAKLKAASDAYNLTGPAFDYMKALPEDQRAQAYPKIIQQLSDQGVDVTKMDHPYDPQIFDQYYGAWQQSKPALENMAAKANIANTQSGTAKNYAEIGKIQNDIGQNNDKLAQSLKDDLDPNKARGGNLAKSQAVINAADRLGAMFKQFPDYNIPKAQQTELVSAFGAILNGGSAPLQSQMEELVPKSALGDASSLAAWVTNSPNGQNQQKFMKLLNDSVDRERGVAEEQVKTAQVQRLSAHSLLKQKDPDSYWSIAHSYGIDPENVKNGKYVPSQNEDDSISSSSAAPKPAPNASASANAPKATGADAQALQWLKSADPTSPDAFAVRAKLKKKGLL